MDIATNSIPISNFPNGLYFIRIENSNKTDIKQFLKI